MASGKKLKKDEREPGSLFFSLYQQWYSEAHGVVRQILPSRLSEFEWLYQGDEKRKRIDIVTYTIKDWLLGIRDAENIEGRKRYYDAGVVFMRFRMQNQILKSVKIRFESSLLDIKQLLKADLFDSEAESAQA